MNMHRLFIHLHSLCGCLQGERGEPGFITAADGSMMSGLVGPGGPKGVKVISPVTVVTFQINFPCALLLHALTKDIKYIHVIPALNVNINSLFKKKHNLENLFKGTVHVSVNVFLFVGR